MENPIKMDDLGYYHFRKPPYSSLKTKMLYLFCAQDETYGFQVFVGGGGAKKMTDVMVGLLMVQKSQGQPPGMVEKTL